MGKGVPLDVGSEPTWSRLSPASLMAVKPRSEASLDSPWWPFCFICHRHLGLNGGVGSCPEPGDSLRWQSCSPACQGLAGTVRTWLSSEEEAGGRGASCPYHFLSSLVCWVAHLRCRPHCSRPCYGGTSRTGKSSSAGLGELGARQPRGCPWAPSPTPRKEPHHVQRQRGGAGGRVVTMTTRKGP